MGYPIITNLVLQTFKENYHNPNHNNMGHWNDHLHECYENTMRQIYSSADGIH